MIEKSDLKQLQSRGISQETVEWQLHQFKQGFPYANVQRPATVSNGILALRSGDESQYVALYQQKIQDGVKPAKFVPASGAATRMFKDLFTFLAGSEDERSEWIHKEPYKTFFSDIEKFPFYQELMNLIPEENRADPQQIIHYLLNPMGLNYGLKPKGVLLFHSCHNSIRTAAMEHLYEGLRYACDCHGEIAIHFTVSPEHQSLFESSLQNFIATLEIQHGIKFNITYSFQKPSTDTIAVDRANKPFRTETGELVFRPAGHGALIENLNELEQDLVFIKNIDNVMIDDSLPTTVHYKKVLAGFALSVQSEIFDLLTQLDGLAPNALENAARYLSESLGHIFPAGFHSMEGQMKRDYLHHQLNRPIRVCGMVKNSGEPGGGPFWVEDSTGNCSLQIVESAQIDLLNTDKQSIVNQCTHFNPVDLVCCTKGYRGEKFDLTGFVDPQTGFISEKSMNGRPLRALELPGLWNGAMAGWLTYFIEVPAETFNPVKTVMDLLRPSHQPLL